MLASPQFLLYISARENQGSASDFLLISDIKATQSTNLNKDNI